MKIAIMQPYFFPYIGYFQLINAVDKFIFYDDVSFIKGGWINRNMIQVQGEKKYINLNLNGASSFKNINEIRINGGGEKILKTIKQNYSKAPYFEQTFNIVEDVIFNVKKIDLISEISASSVISINSYLGLKKKFEYSSKKYSSSTQFSRADRIIDICKMNNAVEYINPIGGKELYKKSYFQERGVNLKFISNNITEYKQFNDQFISNLSMIDVLMFNNPETIKKMLTNFTLD